MGVAGMLRNRWPECFGMPGRNRPATSGRIGAENALKERLRYLERYRWSSLGGYVSGKREEPWVVYDAVLGYVGGSRRRYGEFIEEGLQKGYRTLWEELRGQVVLGEEGFLERVKGKWGKGAVGVGEGRSS